MGMERHVKLFKNGRNQAVRIPREFELPGEDAIMRKEGDRLIISRLPKGSRCLNSSMSGSPWMRNSPKSKTCHPSRSIFDAIFTRYEHHFRLHPKSQRARRQPHSESWQRSCLHKRDCGGGVTLRRSEKCILQFERRGEETLGAARGRVLVRPAGVCLRSNRANLEKLKEHLSHKRSLHRRARAISRLHLGDRE